MSHQKVLEYSGFCPICQREAIFKASTSWFRGSLTCSSCVNGSVPRERALALILEEQFPKWRSLRIHECSPIDRGISAKIAREAENVLRTQFYPGSPTGEIIDGFRNEDLQALTLPSDSFDLFISLDVMEHIPNPEMAVQEVWRTLKPDGAMLCTFPIRKGQVAPMEWRVRQNEDGSVTHLKPPEYHGNPVSKDGSLVTVDYGYDIHQQIAEWAHFDTRVYRFHDYHHGIIGEYTEVILARKRR